MGMRDAPPPEDFTVSLTLSHRFGRFELERKIDPKRHGREETIDARSALAMADSIGPGVADLVRTAVRAQAESAAVRHAEDVARQARAVEDVQATLIAATDARRLADELAPAPPEPEA
jgi:hypothetical protein